VNTLPQRLRYLREKHGLSQKDLAQKFGISNFALSRYERGEADPDSELIKKFAEFFGVSADYLLGLTDNPDVDDILRRIGAVPLGKTVKLPVLGVIRAGEPIYAEQNIIGEEEVPVEDVRGGEYFFLLVEGDSMINAGILPGARVLVRRQDFVDDGAIAVVLVNGEEATVKRVRFLNGQILLMAANPAYEPKVYPADEVKIIGKVVQSINKYE